MNGGICSGATKIHHVSVPVAAQGDIPAVQPHIPAICCLGAAADPQRGVRQRDDAAIHPQRARPVIADNNVAVGCRQIRRLFHEHRRMAHITILVENSNKDSIRIRGKRTAVAQKNLRRSCIPDVVVISRPFDFVLEHHVAAHETVEAATGDGSARVDLPVGHDVKLSGI